jgi:hypothetical protein
MAAINPLNLPYVSHRILQYGTPNVFKYCVYTSTKCVAYKAELCHSDMLSHIQYGRQYSYGALQ